MDGDQAQRFMKKMRYLVDPREGAGDPELKEFYPLAQQIADLKAVYEPLEEIAGKIAHAWLDGGRDEDAMVLLDDIGEWCRQYHPDWQG